MGGVGRHAELRDVEAFDLHLFGYTQWHDTIHDFEDHVGKEERVSCNKRGSA